MSNIKSTLFILFMFFLCKENFSRDKILSENFVLNKDCTFQDIISLYPLQEGNHNKIITINGYVEDESSGERMIGANIYDPKTIRGTTSNNYGFFSIKAEAGIINLACSFVGYKTEQISFYANKDTLIYFNLIVQNEIEEVIITAQNQELADQRLAIGTFKLPLQKLGKLPAILGEGDIMKTVQLLPGISEGSEGNSGLFVRGGESDQNLILLDGIMLFNPNHLFGFYSVFNDDAIKDAKVVKGGFPARYGGRLSSVLDMHMKEGNMKKLSGSATIGLVASKFYLEGPIVKDKTSFFISARRTYADLIAKEMVKDFTDFDESGYYFYDINAKLNHKFSDRNRLYLSYYKGKDVGSSGYTLDESNFNSDQENDINWGNSIYGLRWNSIISSNLFLNTVVSYSEYDYLNKDSYNSNYQIDDVEQLKNYSSEINTGINVFSAGLNFNWFPNTNHQIRYGARYFYNTYNTGVNSYKLITENGVEAQTNKDEKIYATEGNVYVEDEMKITSKWHANVGVHYSLFKVKNKTYNSLEPRLSTKYFITDNFQVSAGAAIMKQYIHLLSLSRISMASDIWVPATENVKPSESQQLSLGLMWNLKNKFSFSVEGYYKQMANLLEYSEGASYFSEESWQMMVEQGKGKSYGIELLVEKKGEKLTGWISYTLSKSDRKFENINQGMTFPARYDKRHNLSIVLDYKLTNTISVNALWTYKTGNAETLALIKYPYNLDTEGITDYGEGGSYTIDLFYYKRNGYRTSDYHRLDLAINWQKQYEKYEHKISIGVYNLYNRKNPYKVSVESYNRQYIIEEINLFELLPFISYSIKF